MEKYCRKHLKELSLPRPSIIVHRKVILYDAAHVVHVIPEKVGAEASYNKE